MPSLQDIQRRRSQAYSERNELIATLARVTDWPIHLMPSKLPDMVVVCIHAPLGYLAWLVSYTEADSTFAGIPFTEVHGSHETRVSRSNALKILSRKDIADATR